MLVCCFTEFSEMRERRLRTILDERLDENEIGSETREMKRG